MGFSHPELFLNQPTSKNFLKHDADDEFYSLQNDTLHVNYAQTDYVSSYTANLPRQDLSVRTTRTNLNQIKTFPMIPHPNRLFSQKYKSVKASIGQYFIIPPRKNKVIAKTNFSSDIAHRNLTY